jgi:hypothetical protein
LFTLAASAQVSTTSTTTGPNGKTATRSTTRGGGNVQSTLTGPNGQTGSRSTVRGGGNSQTTVTDVTAAPPAATSLAAARERSQRRAPGHGGKAELQSAPAKHGQSATRLSLPEGRAS